jgi:hypothetical protein
LLLDKREQYRHLAQQCLELLRTMQSEQERAMLLQMATVWTRLAERAEIGDDTPQG